MEGRLRLERLLAVLVGRASDLDAKEIAEAAAVERLVADSAAPLTEGRMRFLQAIQAQRSGGWPQAKALLQDAREQLDALGEVDRVQEVLMFEGFVGYGSGNVGSGVAAVELSLDHARRHRLNSTGATLSSSGRPGIRRSARSAASPGSICGTPRQEAEGAAHHQSACLTPNAPPGSPFQRGLVTGVNHLGHRKLPTKTPCALP